MMIVARRLAMAIPVAFGVSLLTFFIMDVLPGNAAQLLGADASPQQVARLEAQLNLDRPVIERYWSWQWDMLRGDLGQSLINGQSVSRLIAERLPLTLELIALALTFSAGFAVLFALLAARDPAGPVDRLCAVISMAAVSAPSYVLAPILVLTFAIHLDIVPSLGFVPISGGLAGNLQSLALPAIALGMPLFGLYTRFLRGDLVDQLERKEYIVAARAKGLGPWQVLLRHALPNSLFGLVTLVGMNAGALIGGAVIIEQIFALPGVGQLLLQSINLRDVMVVQAVVLLSAWATVVANLCVDLLYVVLDPRVRHGAA